MLISHNGTFTINSPKGQHRTFRIKTAKHGRMKGMRILSLLTGPDNTANFEGFANVTDDGENFYVWRTYQGVGNYAMYARMLVDLLGEHSELKRKGYELLQSTVCRVCNRKLTTPESIKFGIGPECRKGR